MESFVSKHAIRNTTPTNVFQQHVRRALLMKLNPRDAYLAINIVEEFERHIYIYSHLILIPALINMLILENLVNFINQGKFVLVPLHVMSLINN